jgi:hypothetical protein
MLDSPDNGTPSVAEQIYNRNKYDSHGFRGNVATKDSGLMSYEPLSNTFFIGPQVRTLYDSGHFAVFDFAALHEDDHRRYFELTADEQEDLHQNFLEEIQTNKTFWASTLKFAEELYSHDEYLTTHQGYKRWMVDDPKARGLKKHKDGTTDIRLPLKRGATPVHVGLFITELVSYMSASQYDTMWRELTNNGQEEGKLIGTAKKCRDSMSDNMKRSLARNGRLNLGRPIPDWRKSIHFS